LLSKELKLKFSINKDEYQAIIAYNALMEFIGKD